MEALDIFTYYMYFYDSEQSRRKLIAVKQDPFLKTYLSLLTISSCILD